MARPKFTARPVMAMTSDCSSGAGTWMFTYTETGMDLMEMGPGRRHRGGRLLHG